MKIFAVYFSGTGNTKYAIETFLKHFPGSEMHSIEQPMNFTAASRNFDAILVAHPIYGSDMPLLMQDFLLDHQALFEGMDLITLVTQYLFSGDGGRLAYRLVRKQIRVHLASIHINMPVNLHLPPFLSIKNGSENRKKMRRANRKLRRCAERIRRGRRVNNGRGPLPFLAGFLTQRLWYRTFILKHCRDKLSINSANCVLCGLCTELCPVGNLKLWDGKIVPQNQCILCYRCIQRCPQKAITLFSEADTVVQYQGIRGEPPCVY